MINFRALSDRAYDVNLGFFYELPHVFETDSPVRACDHKYCIRVCWQQLRNLADVTIHPDELTRSCLLGGLRDFDGCTQCFRVTAMTVQTFWSLQTK